MALPPIISTSKGVCAFIYIYTYMGGCQNSGPFLGTLNIRCRIIIGIQKEP